MTDPKRNGATIYGVMLSPEFARVVHKLADKRKELPSNILLELAIKGAECERTHKGK